MCLSTSAVMADSPVASRQLTNGMEKVMISGVTCLMTRVLSPGSLEVSARVVLMGAMVRDVR
jgi:hypothetical protein